MRQRRGRPNLRALRPRRELVVSVQNRYIPGANRSSSSKRPIGASANTASRGRASRERALARAEWAAAAPTRLVALLLSCCARQSKSKATSRTLDVLLLLSDEAPFFGHPHERKQQAPL
ncbi:hypothetical protein MTO96_011970 [Rhipicephalus appendiculatus]